MEEIENLLESSGTLNTPKPLSGSIIHPPETSFDFFNLESYLPYHSAVGRLGDIQYAVYRAKTLLKPEWESEALKLLVHKARSSYDVYGKGIPNIDLYDKKSAIYLCRFSFTSEEDDHYKSQIDEWFSLRFVPGDGNPKRTEDLDFYICEDNLDKYSLDEAIRKRLEGFGDISYNELLSRIVTQSRFCAIRPYYNYADRASSLNNSYLGERMDGKTKTQNKYASLAFALMNRQFLRDDMENIKRRDLITCQMHINLSDVILSFPPNTGLIKMPFTKAYELLGYENPGNIRVQRRKKSVYAYHYPGYFLDINQVAKIFEKLIQTREINPDTVKAFLPSNISLKEFLQRPRISYFKDFGDLLTWKGQIPGSNLFGSRLRDILDRNVDDGALLRLMRVSEWQKGIEEMLDYANKN